MNLYAEFNTQTDYILVSPPNQIQLLRVPPKLKNNPSDSFLA